jgi:hypothetical protein
MLQFLREPESSEIGVFDTADNDVRGPINGLHMCFR